MSIVYQTIYRIISNYVKQIVIVALLLTSIDFIWLKFFFKNYWENMITKIQLTPMKFNKYYIIPTYTLMVLSIIIYILPNIRYEFALKDSVKYGGLLGIIIYGIFDLTNSAVFTNYSSTIALFDTLWGGLLYIVVSFLTI